MIRIARGLAIGVAAFFAVLIASTGAAALAVSPSGSYTATSTNLAFTLDSSGQRLACTSASISATLSSNGLATAPPGSLTFSGCSNPLLGTFTITQTRTVTAQVVLAPIDATRNLVGLRIVVPLDAMGRGAFVIRASGGCSFEGSGSGTIGNSYPVPLPTRIGTTDPFTYLDMRIVLLNVSNCSPLLVVNGLTGRFSGGATLSRGLTVSG